MIVTGVMPPRPLPLCWLRQRALAVTAEVAVAVAVAVVDRKLLSAPVAVPVPVPVTAQQRVVTATAALVVPCPWSRSPLFFPLLLLPLLPPPPSMKAVRWTRCCAQWPLQPCEKIPRPVCIHIHLPCRNRILGALLPSPKRASSPKLCLACPKYFPLLAAKNRKTRVEMQTTRVSMTRQHLCTVVVMGEQEWCGVIATTRA
mmetsp:Transcript_30644/g.51822  ORF Transcript_30644/g.51822 Transcript_30644/m.51822 type:complete len:201 (-) Transcript_30644:716-1318(-)